VRDERSDLEALVPREVARADRLESAENSNTSSSVVTPRCPEIFFFAPHLRYNCGFVTQI